MTKSKFSGVGEDDHQQPDCQCGGGGRPGVRATDGEGDVANPPPSLDVSVVLANLSFGTGHSMSTYCGQVFCNKSIQL